MPRPVRKRIGRILTIHGESWTVLAHQGTYTTIRRGDPNRLASLDPLRLDRGSEGKGGGETPLRPSPTNSIVFS